MSTLFAWRVHSVYIGWVSTYNGPLCQDCSYSSSRGVMLLSNIPFQRISVDSFVGLLSNPLQMRFSRTRIVGYHGRRKSLFLLSRYRRTWSVHFLCSIPFRIESCCGFFVRLFSTLKPSKREKIIRPAASLQEAWNQSSVRCEESKQTPT